MRSCHFIFRSLLIVAVVGLSRCGVVAQDAPSPDVVFATVGGEPVFVADLDLILKIRFGDDPTGHRLVQDFELDQIRQAAATMVVRRHLAMRSLHRIGGEALSSHLKAAQSDLEKTMQQRGTGIVAQAELAGTSADALRRMNQWNQAWSSYLKKNLTESNLRTFHQRNIDQYQGVAFDQIADPLRLRRDASAAMFDFLIRQSSDASVVWQVEALRPPGEAGSREEWVPGERDQTARPVR